MRAARGQHELPAQPRQQHEQVEEDAAGRPTDTGDALEVEHCDLRRRRVGRTRRSGFTRHRADHGLDGREGQVALQLEHPRRLPGALQRRALRLRPLQAGARRRSSVNGKFGLRSSRLTFMTPGVWPTRKKRARRRASASFALTGKVS